MFPSRSTCVRPSGYLVFNGTRYEQLQQLHVFLDGCDIPFERENLPYSFVFEWELAGRQAEIAQRWFMDYWTVSYVFVALYLILVFWGRRWMASRPAYDLQMPLIAWNFFLSVFSIFTAYRGVPEVYRSVRHDSLYYSMCLG